MNIKKLKGIMAESGYSQTKLAEEMRISLQALNAKMNKRAKFTLDEAVSITKILQIIDPVEIFFADDIPNTQQNDTAQDYRFRFSAQTSIPKLKG